MSCLYRGKCGPPEIRAVEDLSALHGFYPKKEKETISCNREGKSDDASRNFIAGQLGGDCPFHLTLKPLSKQSYKATEAASKWSYRKLWDGPVQIASCNCEHGGLCRPSRQNRAMTASRAGKYIEKMPDVALFSLCNYLESRGKLPSSLIKSIMEPVWPTASKNISKHDVFNIRVKIMRLMPTFRKTNQDYEEFKRVANANDMLKGIENTSSLDDDEAYELAQSLWLEMAASANDREDAIFSFIEYLELIKSRAKGFVYELARDTSEIQHINIVVSAAARDATNIHCHVVSRARDATYNRGDATKRYCHVGSRIRCNT